MLVIERPWASPELTCGVWKVCGICILFVMRLFFLLVLLLYLLPSPHPLHTTITKKKKKERNMRRQINALLIQVFVEPLIAVVESFRQWICISFFFLPITVALCDLAFVFFFRVVVIQAFSER